MHKWWAPRLGSVFRTIAIYSFYSMRERWSELRRRLIGGLSRFEKEETERPWNLYLQDVQVDGDVVVLDSIMGSASAAGEGIG